MNEVKLGKVSVIKLQKRYKVQDVDFYNTGGTVLMIAIKTEDEETLIKLIEKGFSKGGYCGIYSPLSYAIMKGLDIVIIKKLIENLGTVEEVFYIPPETFNVLWISPLASAIISKRYDILDVLLDAVDDPNIFKIDRIITKKGDTLLSLAGESKIEDDDFYLKLLQKGFRKIKSKSKNIKCISPINYVIKYNLGVPLIEKLIESGVEIYGDKICKYSCKCNLRNPLNYSLKKGYKMTFNLLLNYVE